MIETIQRESGFVSIALEQHHREALNRVNSVRNEFEHYEDRLIGFDTKYTRRMAREGRDAPRWEVEPSELATLNELVEYFESKIRDEARLVNELQDEEKAKVPSQHVGPRSNPVATHTLSLPADMPSNPRAQLTSVRARLL